jgi:pyruvate dehydrogenase E2 component (dihydrolipoamide acetyltransferase)
MPEAAIIAFGAMRKEVWVEDDGSFVAKETAQLSLSFDHAIIDGGMAGQFIMALKKVLAAPQEYMKV